MELVSESSALVWGIPFAVLLTSTLSAVLGMAGGMILMGILASVLPVEEAMVLHGLAQLTANGWRAALLARHIRWGLVGVYGAGAVAGALLAATLRFDPPRSLLFLVLGALPFVALLPGVQISIERRGAPVLCGFLVTGAHLVAGVSGPLLDVFFVRASLDRLAVVSTKAVTQSAGHLLKIVYFGPAVFSPPSGGDPMPLPWLGLVIVTALLGTTLGRLLLDRVDEERFRRVTGRVVLALGVVALLRAATEAS